MMPLKLAVLLFSITAFVSAKVYDRCELARELKYVYQFPEHEIPTWICIIAHESIYDTAAMNPGSGDHGLFQISQIYWCSPHSVGFGCNAMCASFRDDNIADDVQCARKIFKEHSRISGDGFTAWAVYPLYCKGDISRYINGCFENEIDNNVSFGEEELPSYPITEKPLDEDDDGYDFPPLPSPPKKTLDNVVEGNDDVYEFPQLPTTANLTKTTSLPENELLTTKNSFEENIRNAVTVNAKKEVNQFTTAVHVPISLTTMTPFYINSNSQLTRNQIRKYSTTFRSYPTLLDTVSGSFIMDSTTRKSSNNDISPPTKQQELTTSSFSRSFIFHTTPRANQIGIKPFPQVMFTLKPAVSPVRPLRLPINRPSIITPSDTMPLNTLISLNNRPLLNLSRPTLRPFFTQLTTKFPNASFSVFSKSSLLQSQTTKGIHETIASTTPNSLKSQKQIFANLSLPSTANFLQSTPKPLSSAGKTTVKLFHNMDLSITLEPKFNFKNFKLNNSVKKLSTYNTLKTSSTLKPLQNINNGNNLKREEKKYYNEFPGYFFSRSGNGFKLIQRRLV